MNNTVWYLTKPGLFVPSIHQMPSHPDPGRIRVKVHYCGLCGSDLSHFRGFRDPTYPHSMGHEFVGSVISSGVSSDWQVGTLVTSDFNYRCGTCAQCQAGRSHLCRLGQVGNFSNRAFAQYLDIEESYLRAVQGPAEVCYRYCLAEPLSCCIHALRMATKIQKSFASALVVGAGSLGFLTLWLLSNEAICESVRILELNRHRRNAAMALLSDRVSLAVAEEQAGDVFELVIDTSGSPTGQAAAARSVAPAGTLLTMSHLDGQGSDTSLLASISRRDARILLPYLNGSEKNLDLAIDLISNNWNSRLDEAFAFCEIDNLQSAFEQRGDDSCIKRVIRVDEPGTMN